MAQSPTGDASSVDVLRYDVGWKALNTMLKAGRSLSGHERNCCFLNTRGGKFADISATTGIDFDDDGRVVATTDWDSDGDLDFWITNRTGPQTRFVRNDSVNRNAYIDFRLQGVTCNRDAVGARIIVQLPDGNQRTRTLRAGSGYLAQCSKWLHFGLGDLATTQIPRVDVIWPDGSRESHSNLDVNRRYHLVQGRMPEVRTHSRSVELASSQIERPESTDQARIVLVSPIPIPSMKFSRVDGSEQPIVSPSGKPRLINLWATWCQPCLAELDQWKEQHPLLANAGLEVIAINVDTPHGQARRDEIQALSHRLLLPFVIGFGTDSLVTQWDVLQRAVLQRQRPLPVPSSFLIDGAGTLRVIYKGPVEAHQLVADVQLIDEPASSVLEASVPFPGKWLAPPTGSSPNSVAVRFLEGGFRDQAVAYLRQLESSGRDHPQYDRAEAALLLGAIYVDDRLYEESVAEFKKALSVAPDHHQARVELAGVLTKLGRDYEAATHFAAALVRRPNDVDLKLKLGLAYAASGRPAAAVAQLQHVVAERPSPLSHHQLGNAWMQLGKISSAVEHFEASLQLDAQFLPAANNLAWVLATTTLDSLQDSARAVKLAERVCAGSGGDSAGNLDTLAAAYAAARRYPEAIRTAKRALHLANSAGQSARSRRIEQRLLLYSNKQPYRE